MDDFFHGQLGEPWRGQITCPSFAQRFDVVEEAGELRNREIVR